jgi:hypothetical protein
MRLRSSIIAISMVTAPMAEGAAHAADPTTADCLAASDASLKLGNEHKLRAERAQLLVCAAQTCPTDIRKECLRRVDEVNTQLPTVIFGAKDSAGADLSAVKITMDGEVLAERLEGTALSIDPGEHTFTFETPGQPPVTKRLTILEAEKDRREVIQFGGAAPAPAPVPAPAPAAGAPAVTEATPSPVVDSGSGLGTQKILGIVAGGIGVVGLGVGTAFGLVAISQKNDAQSACPNSPCSTQAGSNKWSTASSTGNVSTVGFIVGGVALAGGALLWFTAPGSTSAQIGLGLDNLQVKGTW